MRRTRTRLQPKNARVRFSKLSDFGGARSVDIQRVLSPVIRLHGQRPCRLKFRSLFYFKFGQ